MTAMTGMSGTRAGVDGAGAGGWVGDGVALLGAEATASTSTTPRWTAATVICPPFVREGVSRC